MNGVSKNRKADEQVSFSGYASKQAWGFAPIILVVQVLLVPLHIFTTDFIDANISLSPISIWLRLATSLLFIICYFAIKLSKGEIRLYLGISFFINAVGDIYLASITTESFLVTHLLGLAIVFIAYALIMPWYPIVYHIALGLSSISIFPLFYYNSPVALSDFLKEGGGFLIFLTLLSSLFNTIRYRALKNGFLNNRKIRDTNEQLKQNLEKFATSQQELKQERDNLAEALTQLHRTQKQLVKTERMASVGKMTGGIAHEINNPLNHVYGGIQGLSACMPEILLALEVCRDLDIDNTTVYKEEFIEKIQRVRTLGHETFVDDVDFLFQDIASGVKKIASIVKSLQLFTRGENESLIEYDIHKSIELAINSIECPSEIVFKKEYDHSICPISCYPLQLSQAIANILSNAVDAMANGGEVLIKTMLDDEVVRIEISDNGEGIEKEVLSKIFEPFFTQKEIGKGVGLGLSVAHGIIEKHLGTIEVESERGKGTVVSICLPCDSDS